MTGKIKKKVMNEDKYLCKVNDKTDVFHCYILN